MKKTFFRVFCAALLSVMTFSVSAAALSAHTSEPTLTTFTASNGNETNTSFPSASYYYSQLSADSQVIYDALADPANLNKLKNGSPITVGTPISISFPQTLTQEEYDTLLASFREENERLSAMLDHLSNAVAAFDRDHSDIFWTGGILGNTAIYENGNKISGGINISLGNTYTVALEITLPLAADWSASGNRSLSNDIALLSSSVSALAQKAREVSSNRYGQLQFLNQQLCKYNAYNTAAAKGNDSYRYPWTALSALDQLLTDNDANGSLKPVCEGYARAMKLVCDELEIPCVLVSGIGNGENHMWNYVQMENGYWYAMDVTWNDSTGQNGYFLVGKDVMNQKHQASGQFMSTGQSIDFLYPILSDTEYQFTTLTLIPSAVSLTGGGTVTLTANGINDPQKLTVICNDASILLKMNPDGTCTATLPDSTASYVFTATYTETETDHLATCTVNVQHLHNGTAQPHDEIHHKYVCSCGETVYEKHDFDEEWVVTQEPTYTEFGRQEKTCACGYVLVDKIDPLKAAETSAPHGTTSDETEISDYGEDQQTYPNKLFGCSITVSGGLGFTLLLLCAAFAVCQKSKM